MGGGAAASGGMGQILELFKMQFLMRIMNGSDTSGGRGSQWNSLLTMLVLFLYDQFAKVAPQYIPVLFAYLFGSWMKPKDDLKALPMMPSAQPPPTTKSIRACIQFERTPETKAVDPRIEAVMHHVCNLPDVRSLRYNGVEMIPNFKDMIMIDNDIWFEILNVQSNPTFSLSASGGTGASGPKQEPILYRLSTYDHDITWLHKFVEQSMERFEQEKKNKLGSESYYFDHITSVGGPYRNPLSKSFCTFSKSKFQSNRSLRNVYLRQIGELQERVEFFMRRRDWYDSKGIPHTLGVVMYGHPGCGKTSTIKAIANETKRHIFNISLGAIKTKEALKELFYNDNVNILADGKMELLNIPIKQRVYVIEDIDAMDSVVVKRSALNEKEDEERKLKIEAEIKWLEQTQGKDLAKRMVEGKEKEDQDQLDLATLLNVLDGVRETPGRIIILSTNYPERLDEALLRPGRFDMMLEFEKHSCVVLKQHLEAHYDRKLTKQQEAKVANPLLNYKWTPAEVSQVLFRRVADMDAAIEDLLKEDPKKMFKFSQMKGSQEQDVAKEEDDSQGTDLTSLMDIVPLPQEEEQKKKSDLAIPQPPKRTALITEPIPNMVLEEGFKMVYDEIEQVRYALDRGMNRQPLTEEERVRLNNYLKELNHINSIYTRYITGFKTEALHQTLMTWIETFPAKKQQHAIPRQMTKSQSSMEPFNSKEAEDIVKVALSDLKKANPNAVIELTNPQVLVGGQELTPLTAIRMGVDITKAPELMKKIHTDFRTEKERITDDLLTANMDETRRNALTRYKEYLREFEQSLISFDAGYKSTEDVETFKENIKTFYDAKQMNSHPSISKIPLPDFENPTAHAKYLENFNRISKQPLVPSDTTTSLLDSTNNNVEYAKKVAEAYNVDKPDHEHVKLLERSLEYTANEIAKGGNPEYAKRLLEAVKPQASVILSQGFKPIQPADTPIVELSEQDKTVLNPVVSRDIDDDYPMSGGTSLSRDEPSAEQLEAVKKAQRNLGADRIGIPHDSAPPPTNKYLESLNTITKTSLPDTDTILDAAKSSVVQDPEANLIMQTLLTKGFDGEFFSGFVQGFEGGNDATSLDDFFKIST